MAAVCVKVMRVHTSRHRHENATAAAVPSHSGRPALTKHFIRPFADVYKRQVMHVAMDSSQHHTPRALARLGGQALTDGLKSGLRGVGALQELSLIHI